MIFESNSYKDTYEIGQAIGRLVSPGSVIALYGDLGTGKTVLTQGLASGLGVVEDVNSPTFTIVQVYEDGRMPLYHFDVYRIGDEEEMYEIGYEDYFYGEGVSLIEWAQLIPNLLPLDHMSISIEKDLEKGFDYRRITVEGKELEQILKTYKSEQQTDSGCFVKKDGGESE